MHAAFQYRSSANLAAFSRRRAAVALAVAVAVALAVAVAVAVALAVALALAVGGLASAGPGVAKAGLLIALCLQLEHARVFAVFFQQKLV